MLFLNIATGVVLVLMGMRYLRKGWIDSSEISSSSGSNV